MDDLPNPKDGQQAFFDKKLNSSMKFFSQGGFVTGARAKRNPSDWCCKKCGNLVASSRPNGKSKTNPPSKCELCGGIYFTLQVSE